MLTKEQIVEVKKQLLKQMDGWPEGQKKAALEQINSMDDKQFEEFLIKNKMIRAEGKEAKPDAGKGECIFCSIIKGKTSSYKLQENSRSLAILEINPLSRGHSLVLSKQHDKLPASALILANKIAKRIKGKLKADEVKIETSNVLGHEIVQIIPLYGDKKLEKHKAEDKELILLQDKLRFKQAKKRAIPVVESKPALPQAPKRFP